jgi:predicted nucleic acid-binding protein
MAGLYVLDTDVLSFVLKRYTRAQRYLDIITGAIVVVSFMTVAELEPWALERTWGPARRARTRRYLDQCVIRPFDRRLCETWAAVTVEARRAGRPIGHADAWVAATARLYDLPLVTHNARHFAGVSGLAVLTQSDGGLAE